jgi:hypothetical protein
MTNFNLKQYLSESKLLQEIKVNKPGLDPWDFKKWKLQYADDNNLYITPINNSRPWIDGRVSEDKVTLQVERNDLKGIEFLKNLGILLNNKSKSGDYNTIELEVSEQDLQNLLYFRDND